MERATLVRLWAKGFSPSRCREIQSDSLDDATYRSMSLKRMAKRQVQIDGVSVLATFPRPLNRPRFLQVGNDPLNGPLSNADTRGNVAHTHRGIRREADQHMGMIAQERPGPQRLGVDMRHFIRVFYFAQ